MFSQQFHAWAHGTKSKLPPLVVALQDMGVLVSRKQHGEHHRAPYNNIYCILGVRPRSWSEPNSEWTEETEISTNQA
ncbi:hypothetical protein YC2023_124716 [Brassica napus]